jgi:hypothetical protein
MIEKFFEKLLGENWRTTLSGLLAGICSFFAVNIDLLEPLPDYWENFIKQLIAFAMGAGLFQLGRASRDNKSAKKTVAIIKEDIEHIKRHEKF